MGYFRERIRGQYGTARAMRPASMTFPPLPLEPPCASASHHCVRCTKVACKTAAQPCSWTFTLRNLYYFPKRSRRNSAEISILPENLRTIRVLSRDHKAFSGAIARPTCRLAVTQTRRAQRGGVRGRQLVDNLFDVDCFAMQVRVYVLYLETVCNKAVLTQPSLPYQFNTFSV